jgi:hypothetical protein
MNKLVCSPSHSVSLSHPPILPFFVLSTLPSRKLSFVDRKVKKKFETGYFEGKVGDYDHERFDSNLPSFL